MHEKYEQEIDLLGRLNYGSSDFFNLYPYEIPFILERAKEEGLLHMREVIDKIKKREIVIRKPKEHHGKKEDSSETEHHKYKLHFV